MPYRRIPGHTRNRPLMYWLREKSASERSKQVSIRDETG